MNKKLFIETFTKFNKWTIISKETIKKNNITHWKCRCECGSEEYIPLNNLMNGSSTQCVLCAAKSAGLKRRKGYEDITGTYWSTLKNGALSSGKFFDIKINEAWDLFVEQNKKCAYSGEQLFLNGYETNDYVLSNAVLTLINPEDEYHIDNIRWVDRFVNKMKSNLHEKDFISLIKKINNNYG